MTETPYQKDLVLLVADSHIEAALRGLLTRHKSLGIAAVDYDAFRHPHHDSGCLRSSHEILSIWLNAYRYALVVFDRRGCGEEDETRTDLEAQVEERLRSVGWGDRARAVVIDPEVEVWAWSDSPHVETALGWQGRHPGLRDWLRQQRFVQGSEVKPAEPRTTLEAALREVRRPKSSALFTSLARTVSLERCNDAAFLKVRQILQGWFGSEDRLHVLGG